VPGRLGEHRRHDRDGRDGTDCHHKPLRPHGCMVPEPAARRHRIRA
jgi:hypothetical protein